MGDRSTSSFELDGDQLKRLNPSGKKTGFQCEFFAVLVYVDNDGVRDALISCTTADPVGSVMLAKVLELQGSLAVSAWFARFPSKSNIADSLSGGDIDDLIATKAKHQQVEPLELLQALGPVL